MNFERACFDEQFQDIYQQMSLDWWLMKIFTLGIILEVDIEFFYLFIHSVHYLKSIIYT